MKKIILLSVFLGLAVSYSYCQTYYYQAVASIDKNGAKSKASGGVYITFVNNQNTCYHSDKDGYRFVFRGDEAPNFNYVKTQNGTHVYHSSNPYERKLYYFSSDFSQWIEHFLGYPTSPESEWRTEYKRTNGPQDDDDIPTF
jgi:hypothetical protein